MEYLSLFCPHLNKNQFLEAFINWKCKVQLYACLAEAVFSWDYFYGSKQLQWKLVKSRLVVYLDERAPFSLKTRYCWSKFYYTVSTTNTGPVTSFVLGFRPTSRLWVKPQNTGSYTSHDAIVLVVLMKFSESLRTHVNVFWFFLFDAFVSCKTHHTC